MRDLRHLLAAVILTALASCGPPRVASAAEDVAHQMRGIVGSTSGPVTVKSVEAEGDLVVITFDGDENWRQGYPSFMITGAFLRTLCEQHRGSFRGGSVGLRIDTLEAGENRVTGTPVRRCPTQ